MEASATTPAGRPHYPRQKSVHKRHSPRGSCSLVFIECGSNNADVWQHHCNTQNTRTDRATDGKCITSVMDGHTDRHTDSENVKVFDNYVES